MIPLSPVELLVVVIIMVAIAGWRWRQSRTEVHGPLPRASAAQSFAFEEPVLFQGKVGRIADQAPAWQEAMYAIGQKLRRAKVRSILLVHGTFTGDDPVGIVRSLKVIYPKIPPRLEEQARKFIRSNMNALMRDGGNFNPEYVRLMEQGLGSEIPCHEVIWSSENHHIGRLRGTRTLLTHLVHVIREQQVKPGERLLLVGHSHAGQLFALLSLLLEKNDLALALQAVMIEDHKQEIIREELDVVRRVTLDFVTFGSPVRYDWGSSHSEHLLNIINHRGQSDRAGSWRGLFNTAYGDYIQQIGVVGSDLLAGNRRDREWNRLLDQYLGVGADLRVWARLLKARKRVPPFGTTYLVDYKDQGGAVPNGAATIFGHAIYTRFRTMLFNLQVIVDHFYR